MTFYSLDYLLSQNNFTNKLYIGLLVVAFLAVGIGLIASFRNRLNMRYRDLTIIAFLAFLFLAGLTYTNLENTQTKSLQQNQMAAFAKSYAKDQDVKKSELSFNSTTMQDGMIAKEGNKFYQITLSKDQQSYSRTEVYLINTKAEVVQ
ncbi:DUF3290 domain-containing protein [Fructobacillus fructosus]|uniref:DUF3290 domain-containing protein n=1 Tax=Fructobacillus fructosus TaxID=1631 RepID=A0ABN9YY99_9LACO|nr:DUF3290 domain-containing protein [Fructobacillus fructosus]MBD9366525.1 DUF3290 domain-containing protein [Leuconostoc mesenteroides]KRN52934.1 hypothetical protein IV71_GL000829 [Fructobacillus fructosus KCTC 3544]MBC9119241.1 DUF3290 domain-containing protein [Fructobacillus fructosus]MCK8638917.1 DUF3290 domain-containing protein [Fructobacillus fructosus]CAK1242761.1 hypothetical protein R54866_LGPIEIPA_00978 [Fructobacillus fructosus]